MNLPTISDTNTSLGPQQMFQPGQKVINPSDGKEYEVHQQIPGQGVTLIDSQSQRKFVVKEPEVNNLKPVLQTQSNEFSVESIVEDVLSKTLNEPTKIKVLHSYNKEGFKMKNNWCEIRKQLRTLSQLQQKEIQSLPTYNEPRQSRAIRELGLAEKLSYDGTLMKEIGRDLKTGLPMRGGDDIEVGMTEFPKDVDKKKDPEGYGKWTMEEIDKKFEEERPHFKNEQYLPEYTKKREESDTYLTRKEKNIKIKDLREDFPKPRYSSLVEIILDDIIGITKSAQDEAKDQVEPLPVQYKEVKRAPKLEEYIEPAVLKEADPDVKTAIELFKETQAKIQEIQEKIKEKTEPLQKAIVDATKELNEELAKNAALLKTSLDMIFNELNNTQDKVEVLQDEIYAAIQREKAVTPSATLTQIIKKAQEINPQIAEEINKIKALIENENTKLVLERFVYKYPVSEVQKKKISSVEDNDILVFVKEAFNVVEELKDINSQL